MRSKEEIINDKRVLKVYKNVDTENVKKLKLEVRSIKASDKCLVSITCMEGWEHLSVSHKNKIPSWLCMQEMKEMFFKDDEECIQIHPKADNYINNNEYTLHIWRPIEAVKQIPPSILVGFRANHIDEDVQKCKELHEKIGCPLTEDELRWLVLSGTEEGRKQLEKEMSSHPELLIKMSIRMGIIQ